MQQIYSSIQRPRRPCLSANLESRRIAVTGHRPRTKSNVATLDLRQRRGGVVHERVDARDDNVGARRGPGALQGREEVVSDAPGEVRPGDVGDLEGRCVAVARLAVV